MCMQPEGKIWALDFSVYLRFDAFALNPEESTTSSGKCIKPLSLDVKWKKLVNPPHAFSQEAIRKRDEDGISANAIDKAARGNRIASRTER